MSSASTIGEIVELVDSSDKSWEDAAQTAVKEAVKTIRNVHEIDTCLDSCKAATSPVLSSRRKSLLKMNKDFAFL